MSLGLLAHYVWVIMVLTVCCQRHFM